MIDSNKIDFMGMTQDELELFFEERRKNYSAQVLHIETKAQFENIMLDIELQTKK